MSREDDEPFGETEVKSGLALKKWRAVAIIS
jgi:hypothetical protein